MASEDLVDALGGSTHQEDVELRCHAVRHDYTLEGTKMQDQPWPFDQAANVTAITTRRVLDDRLPVLSVVHYSDDHSWAFTCGTTNESDDGRVICMSSALELDPTLAGIADLPPGWCATRTEVGGDWQRYEDPSF